MMKLQSQATQSSSQQQQGEEEPEAPPKKVAVAMERLSQAARLIADIRMGADRLLEAVFVSGGAHESNRPLNYFLEEDASMRQHFLDLRSIGKQLEESGVLNESLRLRSNYWGLHMPLVCPDGAVVAYAWKRQLAGQAGASAVDRTRLALKAFTDQKKRFFPHLEDGQDTETTKPAAKRPRVSHGAQVKTDEELSECKTLSDILKRIEKEVPNLKVHTYERLEWLKKASSLPASTEDNSIEALKDHSFHSSTKLRPGSQGAVSTERVAVIELLLPSVFRAVISLHPAGSIDPDAVAFFSSDEGGSYLHSRGSSVYHIYRHITEHAAMALQHFSGIRSETALHSLLFWICGYQNLFSKVCSKCKRLLAMDRKSAILLPPVRRPFQSVSCTKLSSSKDQNVDNSRAYHIGCFLEEQSS
ncbi:mediator of RNA polymerase II transcription subunit 27 [Rutidosis leptorrhynchoides]|uniref:mediator of RNA polymerase II transcription subunit 27 n=1 Tax=Rutidosis leptorrhynchoides TaxID=125765 RepID=UPI003A9A396F